MSAGGSTEVGSPPTDLTVAAAIAAGLDVARAVLGDLVETDDVETAVTALGEGHPVVLVVGALGEADLAGLAARWADADDKRAALVRATVRSDASLADTAHALPIPAAVPATTADAKGFVIDVLLGARLGLVVEHDDLSGVTGPVPDGEHRVAPGASCVARAGRDVTVITYGPFVVDALTAARALASDRIDAEVVDLRAVGVVDDRAVLSSVQKTKNALVVHDGARPGGLAAELSCHLHEELFSELEHPVQRLSVAGVPAELRAAEVRAAVRRLTS